jgi:hypothetical protein
MLDSECVSVCGLGVVNFVYVVLLAMFANVFCVNITLWLCFSGYV